MQEEILFVIGVRIRAPEGKSIEKILRDITTVPDSLESYVIYASKKEEDQQLYLCKEADCLVQKTPVVISLRDIERHKAFVQKSDKVFKQKAKVESMLPGVKVSGTNTSCFVIVENSFREYSIKDYSKKTFNHSSSEEIEVFRPLKPVVTRETGRVVSKMMHSSSGRGRRSTEDSNSID